MRPTYIDLKNKVVVIKPNINRRCAKATNNMFYIILLPQLSMAERSTPIELGNFVQIAMYFNHTLVNVSSIHGKFSCLCNFVTIVLRS
jgi:hypothetical protein